MNILFVLYGDFSSNSVNPLALYARELHMCGHDCAVAVPYNLETVQHYPNISFRPLLYGDVLNNPELVFSDGRPADVIHAWTPRENVRRFITSYMTKCPTPLVVYLEDNESWIAFRALGLEEVTLVRQTEQSISELLPYALSHPFLYDSFIGLADAVAVIQDKLEIDVPPWVYCETVMPGVDLEFFSPRVANPLLRKQYGVVENERVIVYPGGLNGFTKPALETLCLAVGLINRQGYPCRLLRTGPVALDFIDQLPPDVAASINDLGVLPRSDLPDLLALADVLVQPGKIDPFEELRLPGKLPEFLAMGRPVVMPDVNIAHLFKDGVDAVLTHTGGAEEIAAKCIGLFSNSQQADGIGQNGRRFAEKYFDVKLQARRIESVYKIACDNFNPAIADAVWRNGDKNTPVTMLLARKLKLLADSRKKKFSFEAGEILKEHARYIELMHLRLKGLEAGITERVSQIVNLNHAAAEREGQIADLNQDVAERDGQIVNLNQAIRTLTEQVAKRNEVIAERDGQIVNFNRAAAEREGQIADLNQDVAERDGQIVNLNQTIQTLTEQVARRNEIVAERDGQIAGLNQVVTVRDGQIASLSQVMVKYTEALRTIEEIRGSSSWRVTAPMRYVSSKIKNIIGVIKLLPSIIRFGSGVAGSVRKTWRAFSREGWRGVKRRILFVGGNRSGFISSTIRTDLTSAAVDRNDYGEWVRRYDTLTDESRIAMRDRINNFTRTPLISVIMPVYNPKLEWLIEAIESIRTQIYPRWELCIADDASTDKRIRPILESYAREDMRIKVVFREKNGHISAASNSALVQTTGEWIALLDHDDLLAEHALFWVAEAINQNPAVCLIYSDEDKIDASGRRFDPYFKCDWNVDLFCSHNLITHLGIYRAGFLKEIGGFREGLEGAQDYDLALRCVERMEPKQIHHIPRVLYHWRTHAKSTANSVYVKPYALLAGKKALDEYLQRQGMNAVADLLDFGMYRIRYTLPDDLPLISLIIPTRNNLHLIQRCIESILNKTTYLNYEIMIVDNGSDDPATLQYFKQLQSDPRIRVVRDDRPFNFSALNNAAVKLARGEIVGLLNNDLEVISPEWLSEMVSHALRSEVGAVGARLWYPKETLQHGGVVLGVGGVAGHAHKQLPRYQYGYFGRASVIQSFSAVSAACLVIRKSIYEEVGGFNEMDLQVAFNDIDFCLRLREKNYRNVWTPYAELYHHESATRGLEDSAEKQMRFTREVQWMKKRWGDTLLKDPAYSPNFTLDYEDFSLAWPPRVNSI